MKNKINKQIKQRVYRYLRCLRIYDKYDKGFEKVFCRNIKGKEEIFLFKPFFHESPRHGVLVFEVAEYLKQYTKKVKTYLSVKPDIVFEINNKEFAVEIETGVILKKNKKQLLNKVENLRENYKRNWFFVITDRNLVKSYKRYGKTYTKRNVLRKIDKIMWKEGVNKKEKSGENQAVECENIF